MPSPRFKELKGRQRELKKLLPKAPRLTGKYTPQEYDGIGAYYVLVHAELESYFEDRTLEVINFAESRWKTKRRVSRPLFCIMTYYEGNRVGPPQSFDVNDFKKRNIESLIGEAVALHRRRVSANHGIREKNLSELLFPLGVEYNDLSTSLIASLDSFGKRRGDFAHMSFRRRLAGVQIDPFVEAATVDTMIADIESLDGLFLKIRSA